METVKDPSPGPRFPEVRHAAAGREIAYLQTAGPEAQQAGTLEPHGSEPELALPGLGLVHRQRRHALGSGPAWFVCAKAPGLGAVERTQQARIAIALQSRAPAMDWRSS